MLDVPLIPTQVFHVAGKPFRKLTAKDGQPLKPDEALKEEARVAKAVRQHRERRRPAIGGAQAGRLPA